LSDSTAEFHRICVFCGSSSGEDPRYLKATTDLATALVDRDIGLVYGGSRMGLMGRLAQTALDRGGEVIGVIPRALMNREVAHSDLHDLVVTESMHDRKAEMVARSDGFIAAPGGLGTLEEFLEVLTWAQLGFHRKPCGILDVDGYYQPLVRLLDHAVKEGFLQQAHRGMVLVDSDPRDLLDRMGTYQAPELPRWIQRGET